MDLTVAIRDVLARTFGLAPEEVPCDASFGRLEGWDSMGHVMLIGELEQSFRVSFAIQETGELTSVERIAEVLARKDVSLQ